jgi:DNA-binding NarL/FixJ family response regulator
MPHSPDDSREGFRYPENESAEHVPASERNTMTKRIRVLVADNQQRARQSMKALLAAWSEVEEVGEAASGREAVRLVEAFRPDVVLIDMRMPEMDGLEATQLIKAKWPQVKVIALSMYMEYETAAVAAGADAFVAKGDLAKRLRTILLDTDLDPAVGIEP